MNENNRGKLVELNQLKRVKEELIDPNNIEIQFTDGNYQFEKVDGAADTYNLILYPDCGDTIVLPRQLDGKKQVKLLLVIAKNWVPEEGTTIKFVLSSRLNDTSNSTSYSFKTIEPYVPNIVTVQDYSKVQGTGTDGSFITYNEGSIPYTESTTEIADYYGNIFNAPLQLKYHLGVWNQVGLEKEFVYYSSGEDSKLHYRYNWVIRND